MKNALTDLAMALFRYKVGMLNYAAAYGSLMKKQGMGTLMQWMKWQKVLASTENLLF